MDPGNGKLFHMTAREAKERGFVPVQRDLTIKEQADMQIRLYSPCACGSGQKLKFCCYRRTARGRVTP